MKSTKSVRGVGKKATEEKHYFDILPIIMNLVAIAVLALAYWYMVSHQLFPDYMNYIYWTINVLITYNILAASARSLWAPILSILFGSLGVFTRWTTSSIAIMSVLTPAQCWQLAILGVVGLLITFSLRL
jgi:hypothetical protein